MFQDDEPKNEEAEVAELDKLFSEGEKVDKTHFAEQRTNIKLFKGDHFTKKASAIIDRSKEIATDTKLKISENHTQVICNRLMSGIINQVPSTLFIPNDDKELQDIKEAELNNSVREHAENELDYEDIVDRSVGNFIITGEAIKLYYFDPYDGEIRGYEQKVEPETGEPLHQHPELGEVVDTHMEAMDEMGQPTMKPLEPVQDEKKPVFRGMLKIKLPHPYNTIRHKSADTFKESPFVCFREMVSPDEAKKLIADKPKNEKEELSRIIASSSDQTFKVFDANTGDYSDTQGQVLVKYWFFKKCYKYPKGYFKVQIANKIVQKGELPFGIWPIEYVGFRQVSGSARANSVIKDIRPAQTHLNYLVSNQAFHMVALADDKIITQMGSKLQMGSSWNGMRHFSTNGPPPIVMPGRDAGQFDKAIDRAVNTMYRLADDAYQLEETKMQDAEAMLYARLSARQKHSPIAKKFERFEVNGWKTYMKLAQKYFDDDMVIKCVGKREQINISEFKSLTGEGCTIKAKPVSGTVEEIQGKSMEVRNILQYVGKDLPKTVIAKLVNNLPFMSKESIFGELLMTEKNIDNDILGLDRGEQLQAAKDDEHVEYVRRLKSRMKSSDFRLLAPEIQQAYQMRLQQHQQFQAELAAELKEAEAGFWPMDGGLVKVDVYDTNGKRMLMPQASLIKLQGLLDKQGAGQKELQQLDQAAQGDIQMKALQIAGQHISQMQPPMAPQPNHLMPHQPMPQPTQGMSQGAGIPMQQPMPPHA
jgi:hypothetical protein